MFMKYGTDEATSRDLDLTSDIQ